MRTLLVALLLLPIAQRGIAAQTGDPQTGRTLWEGEDTSCQNCHGGKGEGAFGPDLAGRKLTVAQFTRALRNPWGIMPAFLESQISDRDIADFIAYFDSLPSVAQPGPWRFEVPAGAPRGQELAVATVGCSQCHGLGLNRPRTGAGRVNADFEWFKKMVYDHTAAMPQQWSLLEEQPTPRVRMGNYSRSRLPESLLQEIWTFLHDLGFRPAITGRLSVGVPSANGVTYTLNMLNGGLAGKGLPAEDLTITLVIPAGAKVVSTTAAGYQRVRPDEQARANAAVWRVPRIGPSERQTYTITLSQSGAAADNVRGTISWMKPVVKPGPSDMANIAPAPLPTR